MNRSKTARKKVADANKIDRSERSPQAQLARLDERAPRGAKKERTRLNKLLANQHSK